MSTIIKFALLFLFAAIVAMIVRVVIVSSSHASTPTVDTQRVRVSAADLPQGLLMRDDDLTWKNVPVSRVPSNAIVDGKPGAIELKGALLRHPVTSGTVLVADDVILPSDPGFLAATLQPNMRAISVAVDDVSGNAGLIQPGDYVDVLLTQQMDHKTDNTSPDFSVSSETVVEHVRVLASGSEIVRPKTGNPNEGTNRIRTVTLEVTPHMGEIVAVASHLGTLSLALRSFATASRDSTPATLPSMAPAPASDAERPPVWAGDISRALRQISQPRQVAVSAPSARAPAPPHVVTVYRGSDQAGSDQGATQTAAAGAGNGAPPLPTLPVAK
ncbi:Flp pilus assembly protein CpaB [Paraburkholderia sp.]|uniref:Flp pilus assembly protein CpaB n=1 Tax=Paraburkholderia sp. TaxID=1926495 RepID=UPI002F418A58